MPNCGLAITLTQGAGVVWPGPRTMMYSRPSRLKPPRPLKNARSRCGTSAAVGRLGAGGARGLNSGIGDLAAAAALDLLGQRAGVVEQDHARDRLQQHAVFLRHLLAAAHEDAAGLVHQRRLGAGGDEVHDRVLQRLAVDRVVLVPDHQVDASPFIRQ